MQVTLHPLFIKDLQTHGDPNFAKRVLQKVFDSDGEFRPDTNDHRYGGIPNAWIRYVSRLSTAYRAIYIRTGDNICLYRAGEHSIEDRLAAPSDLAGARVVGGYQQVQSDASQLSAGGGRTPPTYQFLRNQPTYSLYNSIVGRRLIPHKEITLISPFLTTGMLNRTTGIGKALRDLKEDGTLITLITRPISPLEPISIFEALEADGINPLFYPDLHSKLYVFLVDEARVGYGRSYKDFVALGSANLTLDGIVEPRSKGNEELCVTLDESTREYIETYLVELAAKSLDLGQLRVARTRQNRRL